MMTLISQSAERALCLAACMIAVGCGGSPCSAHPVVAMGENRICVDCSSQALGLTEYIASSLRLPIASVRMEGSSALRVELHAGAADLHASDIVAAETGLLFRLALVQDRPPTGVEVVWVLDDGVEITSRITDDGEIRRCIRRPVSVGDLEIVQIDTTSRMNGSASIGLDAASIATRVNYTIRQFFTNNQGNTSPAPKVYVVHSPPGTPYLTVDVVGSAGLAGAGVWQAYRILAFPVCHYDECTTTVVVQGFQRGGVFVQPVQIDDNHNPIPAGHSPFADMIGRLNAAIDASLRS